jgi:peroxiredoxin Q/BCP
MFMPPRADGALAIGDVAAGLTLLDQHGNPHRLAEYRSKHLVLYFYPKDGTPGCTVEGKEFRDLHDQFTALDCAVVGVSTDSVESHRVFAEKHALPFTILADPSGDLARAFGVLKGKVAERATFVLGPDAVVKRTFREVAARGHAQQVLNLVRALLESHRMLGG